MSRTTRKTYYDRRPNREDRIQMQKEDHNCHGVYRRGHYNFYRDATVHGRDGAYGAEIGGACADSPNCYNTWDESYGPRNKRKTKFHTGRLRRIRGKNEINEALDEE